MQSVPLRTLEMEEGEKDVDLRKYQISSHRCDWQAAYDDNFLSNGLQRSLQRKIKLGQSSSRLQMHTQYQRDDELYLESSLAADFMSNVNNMKFELTPEHRNS